MTTSTLKRRRITCITGTRADYPRVKSVIRRAQQSNILEIDIVVTGSHLLEDYGNSIQEIIDDGFAIKSTVPMYEDEFNSPYGMAKSAARCAMGLADALKDLNPDLVLLTVDRVETLAAAMAASLMNFPIAHIQGGELTGTIDESIRHAVTKMSHIHFPATNDAAQRIIQMGETPERVFTVGCPYIDEIRNCTLASKTALAEKYGFDPHKRLIILTQHPVTTEYPAAKDQVDVTIDALQRFADCEVMAFFSNTDAGGQEIIRRLASEDFLHLMPNMKSIDFLSLMNCADVMVGNSSAAIREAPTFGLPAINIGTRQQGRLRASNVIDVGYDSGSIVNAINFALNDKGFLNQMKTISNPYGDGESSKRIIDILETIEISDTLVQKTFSNAPIKYL